jgi:hypothetical protein
MPKTVQDRFFKDPEWHLVTDLIEAFINPLLDMDTIDTRQPAEQVKAEIIGRKLAYKQLRDFCEQSRLLAKQGTEQGSNFKKSYFQ